MTKTQGKPPAGMRAGIRRPRGPRGTWSFVLDMGLCDAQRCTVCGSRSWVGGKRLDKCPKPGCGGELRDTRERRQSGVGGFATQADAKLARASALDKLGKGHYVPPARMTVGEYLRDVWLPQVEKEDLRPSTLLGYRRNVVQHIIGPASRPFALGQIPLGKLKVKAIREHYEMLGEPYPVESGGKLGRRPGLSVRTRRLVHATLHRAMNDAIEAGYLDHNPTWKAASNLKIEPHELDVWTADELRGFLAATLDTPNHPLWRVLAMTGMRRGEACGLQWGDFDAAASTLSVRRSRVPVGGVVHEQTPKTHKTRTVDLDPDTVAVLKALHDAQRKARPVALIDDSREYLFVTQDGQPVHPNDVSRSFLSAVTAAGARAIRLHDLRHSHASLMIDARVPISVVSERLGHANANITLGVYTHQLRESQKQAACTVGDLVRAGAKGAS